MRYGIWLVLFFIVVLGGSSVLAAPNGSVCEGSVWAYFPEAFSIRCADHHVWTTREPYDCNCRTEAREWRCPVWINGNRYYRNSSTKLNIECFAIRTERVCDTCYREVKHSRCVLWQCCTVRYSGTGVPFYDGCYHSRERHGCHDPNQ